MRALFKNPGTLGRVRVRPFAVLLVLASLLVGLARAQEVALSLSTSVRQYTRQEVTFALPESGANPYDPAQIAVDALFTTPAGKIVSVPAFYWQEYEPLFNLPGPGKGWKVRFTPDEPGLYTVSVRLSRGGAAPREIARTAFECTRSIQPGFVRRVEGRLELTTGEPFFPLGANRPWGDVAQPERYLDDLERLAAAGANCVRVWMAPWWMRLETRQGVYDPDGAAMLDLVLAKAEALGLRVILVLEQHGNLEPAGAEVAKWDEHPYNIANGGPCQANIDFFTHDEARRLFRNRLRYIVARWGYSTSILCWELFNEVEWVPLEVWDKRLIFERWHAEMTKALRDIDPFRHLISTSADVELQRRLLRDGRLDMVQVHIYERDDLAVRIAEVLPPLVREFGAPVLVGEFGMKPDSKRPDYVTRGVFAAAMTGCGALPWLQDVADPGPGYTRLSAAKTILQTVRWQWQEFKPATPALIDAANGNADRMPEAAFSALHAMALVGKEETLVYVYSTRPERLPVERRRPLRLVIPDVPLAGYSLEFWDCAAGTVMHRQVVRPVPSAASPAAGFQIDLPWGGSDVLVRLNRLNESSERAPR